MLVRITLDLDVGDEAYADVITYSIDQHGQDGIHLVAEPASPSDIADAVEWALVDIVDAAIHESFELALDGWKIQAVHSAPIEREGS